MFKYLDKFLATGAITLVSFLVCAWLLRRWRHGPRFKERFGSAMLVGCFAFTFGMMMVGKATYSDNRWITQAALPGRGVMEMAQPGEFARSDVYKGNDNLAMYWDLPNIQCFHSIVPVSLMEFYPEVGVKRDVSSKPDKKYLHLRSLLSVKWLYIAEGEEEQSPMRGFDLVDTRLGYNIYQNQNYLPMGFSYDKYITRKDWDGLPTDYKSRALLHGIYLEDEVLDRHRDILKPVEEGWMGSLAVDELELDVADRRAMTCDTFTVDTRGFTATSYFDRERLVFFSVPYDKGWSATVNGQPARVEKVNIGFMAVRIPAGPVTIRFGYTTPGLIPGAVCSVASLALLGLYLLIAARVKPCPVPPQDYHPAFYLERPQAPRFVPGEFDQRLGEDEPSPPPQPEDPPQGTDLPLPEDQEIKDTDETERSDTP